MSWSKISETPDKPVDYLKPILGQLVAGEWRKRPWDICVGFRKLPTRFCFDAKPETTLQRSTRLSTRHPKNDNWTGRKAKWTRPNEKSKAGSVLTASRRPSFQFSAAINKHVYVKAWIQFVLTLIYGTKLKWGIPLSKRNANVEPHWGWERKKLK